MLILGGKKMTIVELPCFNSQHKLSINSKALLGLDEYQQFTKITDKNERSGIEGLGFALLGLFGETGSLLSELKKKQRDKDAYVSYEDSILEELGDTLWYFANTALHAGIDLSVLAQRAISSLNNWSYQGRADAMTFAALQATKPDLHESFVSKKFEQQLISLAGKVGHLLEDFSAGKIENNGDLLSANLVEIFRVLVSAADYANVSLDKAAKLNMEKIQNRWPTDRNWSLLFDEEFDDDEKMPRQIAITFKEKEVNGKKYVLQQCGGINIGDRLTDNRVEPDDYRFHDVFHLAYAAILGWSPVLRTLLKVKRKSNPEIDENQDGARAIIIEEGISTWIFNYGVRHGYLENFQSIDYTLLKSVHEFVKGYEVDERPLWQWEHAILEGFRIFRELRTHRNGIVTANLNTHTITFEILK
jgi:NTP pyrophosphatase (non-canonical NTP hydrolase)